MKIKYLALALSIGCINPVSANTVTNSNNPVSNSSGSVQNVGIQQLTGRFFQNQYGGGIVCQGTTLSIQPYLVSNTSFSRPYEATYLDPIYSTTDVLGAYDEDGNEIGDNQVDDPDLIIGHKEVRSAQKDQYSVTPGISISLQIPLDRKAVRQCHEVVAKQAQLMEMAIQDKRLTMELNRLALCGKAFSSGYRHKPGTKYAMICSDIELVSKPNTLIDHSHKLTFEKPSAPSSSQK